jgi:chromosome segregation ATPase
LAETKKKLSPSLSTPPPITINLKDSMDQVEICKREIERAKETERNMLESLVFQTKQLEQTKISLEEVKLEIRSLKNKEEEVETLKLRLRLALESEDESKKAMGDMATALNDVSAEAKQVKTWLSAAESELEAAMVSLKAAEGRLNLEVEEIERLKFEKEESASAWSEREKLFVSCMKDSESEINKGKQESLKLIESQRVIREENARLREMLKQAVNEAASLKEALETERDENSRLKESISEKERAFQTVKQDYECLKVSERSARESLKELENMLDSNPTPNKSPIQSPTPKIDEEKEEEEKHNPKPQTVWDRRHSIGEPSKINRFSNSTRKDPVFASLSNIADMKAATRAVVQELGDEYDYIDRAHLEGVDPYGKHKKKPILRRFGDIFRRKSVGY